VRGDLHQIPRSDLGKIWYIEGGSGEKEKIISLKPTHTFEEHSRDSGAGGKLLVCRHKSQLCSTPLRSFRQGDQLGRLSTALIRLSKSSV
jgi:hypothetical protein